MADMILVVNAGSSSLKFEAFAVRPDGALSRQVRGRVDGIGTHPRLVAYDPKGVALIDEHRPAGEVSDLPAANRDGGPLISKKGTRVACYVIPTDEELMIGRHTLALLRAGRASVD